MAQGTVAATGGKGGTGSGAGGKGSSTVSLIPDELTEFRQYESLLRFRDQVVAGSHPRITPTHSLGKAASSTGPPPSAAPGTSQTAAVNAYVNGSRPVVDNSKAYQANMQKPPVSTIHNLPGLGSLSGSSNGPSRSFGSGKPEINPILLEKSEDLKKAEMQLHRQRVERSLRDQIEQRRASHKASLQASEQLAEFDIADVMARAMALVQATSAQSTDDTAANASALSDSFDDNTFYSSQHDTPDSRMVSRLPNESDDERMRDGSPYEPELDMEPVVPVQLAQPAPAPAETLLHSAILRQQLSSSTPNSSSAISQASGANVPDFWGPGRHVRQLLPPGVISSQGSGTGYRSEESGNTGKEQTADLHDLARVNERLLSQVQGRRDSPLVRAHDLSPVAPQPAHVSPLAIARQRPMAGLSDSDTRRATPAQVAALRKQHSTATSPDSSPQGNRADKKKNKKKRKKERVVTEVASPYIKAEPRSPSPLTAPPYARPNKRQRKSLQQPSEFSYDESRYGQPIELEDSYPEQYQPRPQREERVVGYERADGGRPRHDIEPALVQASPRSERVYFDETRSISGARPGPPDSPHGQAPSYLPREVRTVRQVSRVIDSPHGDTTYYRDARTASRMSVRPTVYRARSQSPLEYEHGASAMPPPRAVPTRIVVDAFGREYIEPPRSATVLREGMAPYHRVSDAERIYERAPPPGASARRTELYEDDSAAYRPASPTYAAPRRVITQPEFAYRETGHPSQSDFVVPEHRVYREGPHPAGEYLSSRPRLDSRATIEPPREYITRSASVRPQADSARYETAPGYERRVPEERPREYFDARPTSVRPPTEAVRYEIPVAYERHMGDEPQREYASARSVSVRPTETIRYEVARDYGARVGSVRPEIPVREYVPGVHPDGRRDVMQPPPAGRSYSTMPGDAQPQVIRREFSQQSGERYYGRPPPPPPPTVGDDEVIVLDRPPREVYRELR
ncbi:hypothetical protein B0H67DRAFT_578693 [Lasiosphaeris hirsuta]|uniref:Uncharacterized protein n=1 Tax=Lasiosphaeris hirsuta TaxID=260670 RepID=A0AA40DT80_9PEZI|nr:hypothetical protein B0H67DRAFT_578693 [Lasiosphaeris hirsuta]